MRILYLNPSGQMGGAETSLVSLMASVREAQPDWELCLAVGEDGPLAERARQMGIPAFVLPFPPATTRLGDSGGRSSSVIWAIAGSLGSTAAYTWRLAMLIRKVRPTVIHSNGFKMHLLGGLARPRRTRFIWHMHDYASTRPLIGRLLRPFERRVDTVIANSHSVAADVAGLYPAARVVTIYNAIDVQKFAPCGETLDLDAAAGLPVAAPGTLRVGMLATFARWKGHEVFLRALSLVQRSLAIRGYIIGGPIYQTSGSQYSLTELKQMAEQLELGDRVGFTGFLDDAPRAMRSLDIMVHASTKPEPFGMTIIEGMACGKAVIASRAGGANELFADGVNALGHAPGDFRELARQIEMLARDGELRLRLGRAARAAAVERFQGHHLAGKLVPLYQRICDAKGRDRQANAPGERVLSAGSAQTGEK